MSKYYKPVFSYKLSFDPDKGEKHTIKVIFSVPMDGDGQIGAAISEPAEGEAPAAVTHKVQTKVVEVRICQSTAVDEVLSTLEIFKRARKVTGMNTIQRQLLKVKILQYCGTFQFTQIVLYRRIVQISLSRTKRTTPACL